MADLYTFGNMEKAVCTSASTTATGYAKENMLDYNPDTSWKPTGSSTNYLIFDMVDAVTVTGAFIFLNNYTALVAAQAAGLYYSDDGTSWTTAGAGNLELMDTSTPMRFQDVPSATHRYWRWATATTPTQPIFGIVAFCIKHSISQGNELPEQDSEKYYNRITNAPGGRTFARGVNRNKSMILPRSYKFSGTTDWTALQNAFNDSNGSLYPLILQEGTNQSDAKLVRFGNDELNKNELDYQFYNPKVTFIELPYIDDGETY